MINLYQSVEDFVADESFQNFVLAKNTADIKKWESFIKENPLKEEVIKESAVFVKLLSPGKSITPPKNNSSKKSIYAVGLLMCLLALSISFILLKPSTKNSVELPQIVQIAEAENLSIILPDNSTVELRAGSQLSYAQDWNDLKLRKVKLEGEAYFDIVKSENRIPFEVEIENGAIEVLGTKFLARSHEKNNLVFLEEGKVSYHNDEREFIIKPGDILQLDGDKFSVEHNVDIRRYDSWRKQELAFKNVSIEEIIETINNSYGMNVIIGNSKLKERKITATVDKNDPLLLLDAIAAIYNIEIINESNKLILK